MQQKQIQVGNKKLLALDMPEDAIRPVIEYSYLRYTLCKHYKPDQIEGTELFYLGDGDYEIIGFKNDITEEQWAEIVEKEPIYPYPFHVLSSDVVLKDYLKDEYNVLLTAKESGLSLLQANNIDYLNCLIIQVI